MSTAPLAFLSVLALLASPSSSGPASQITLVDFSDTEARAWPAVNDNVMGGRSRGGARIEDGVMVFSGETRLENNGGFSSVRSRGQTWSLEGAQDLLVRMRGTADRGYTMLLRSSARRWGSSISYWQGFELQGDDWQVVRLPISGFYPTMRGRELEGPALDLADIRSMGVMVYDKQAGPFRLEIDWVKAAQADATTTAIAESEGELAPSATASSASMRPDIVALAQSAGDFSTLLQAVAAAGLEETLQAEGPFTVLAPTDEAFAALPEGALADLLRPESRDQLRSILLYHVIPGRLEANRLAGLGSASSAQGQEVAFTVTGGRLQAGGAGVVLNDLDASNGVVHVIDRVLLPQLETEPAQRLIEMAISRGVGLFNAGQVDACAAIYEVTVTALLDLEASGIRPAMRERLADALQSAKSDRDGRTAAWTLRHALDAAWVSLAD